MRPAETTIAHILVEHNDILAIGGRAIYEMRYHKNPWRDAAPETRKAYECRMQELLNELAKEGYQVVKR